MVCELFPICYGPRQPRIPEVKDAVTYVSGIAGLVVMIFRVYGCRAALFPPCLKGFALGDDVHPLRVGLDAVVGLFPFGLLCHFLCGGLPRRAPVVGFGQPSR